MGRKIVAIHVETWRAFILRWDTSAPRPPLRIEPERRRSGVGPGRDTGGWSWTAPDMNEITRILSAIEQGDPKATEQLLPLVYDELRKLAKA